MTIYILYCPNEIHGIRRGSKYIFFPFFFLFFSLAGSLSAASFQQLFCGTSALGMRTHTGIFSPTRKFKRERLCKWQIPSTMPWPWRNWQEKWQLSQFETKESKLRLINICFKTKSFRVRNCQLFLQRTFISRNLRLLIHWSVYNQLESKCLT